MPKYIEPNANTKWKYPNPYGISSVDGSSSLNWE
jgi:hypothetical protein